MGADVILRVGSFCAGQKEVFEEPVMGACFGAGCGLMTLLACSTINVSPSG